MLNAPRDSRLVRREIQEIRDALEAFKAGVEAGKKWPGLGTGVYSFGPLESITETEFHRQYNTNVLGTLLATQEAVKLFGEKGRSRSKEDNGVPL